MCQQVPSASVAMPPLFIALRVVFFDAMFGAILPCGRQGNGERWGRKGPPTRRSWLAAHRRRPLASTASTSLLPHIGFCARVLCKAEHHPHSRDAMPKPGLHVFDFCEHVVTSARSYCKSRIEYLARFRFVIPRQRNHSTTHLRGDVVLFAHHSHLRTRCPIRCDRNADSEARQSSRSMYS